MARVACLLVILAGTVGDAGCELVMAGGRRRVPAFAATGSLTFGSSQQGLCQLSSLRPSSVSVCLASEGGSGLQGRRAAGMLSRVSMAAKKGKVSKKKAGKGDGGSEKESGGAGLGRRDERKALDALREEIERVGVGFGCSAEDAKNVNELCRGVEACMSIQNAARSSRLWGSWRLKFTDQPAMVKNKGVTGLGSIPFTGFVELTQTLCSNGTAVVEEVLTVPPFGIESRNYLRGTVTQAAPEVIEQTYVEVSMGSFFKSDSSKVQPAIKVGEDVFFSKAVLAISYLDEDLRICRTRSDHVYVFERSSYEFKSYVAI